MNDLFIDMKLSYDEKKGYYDLSITEKGDIEIDSSFDTTVALSIHTDGRAMDSEVSAPERQRGTIVDLFNNVRNGSRLWLLEQSRNDLDARNRAVDYIKTCLAFLIREGFVKEVFVTGKLTAQGLAYTIIIQRLSGTLNKYTLNAWDNSIYKEN